MIPPRRRYVLPACSFLTKTTTPAFRGPASFKSIGTGSLLLESKRLPHLLHLFAVQISGHVPVRSRPQILHVAVVESAHVPHLAPRKRHQVKRPVPVPFLIILR